MNQTTIKLKTKICDQNCYAVVRQTENCVRIRILSDDEFPGETIARPTVQPAALEPVPTIQSINHALVKGYSENAGMPEILMNDGIIAGPVAAHPSGHVYIGEFTLMPDVLAKLKGEEA